MCNQKKMNTVMKQKIFSLLVLMITTVCGVWAKGNVSYGVTLYADCSDDYFIYERTSIYDHGALSADDDGYLNITLETLLAAFTSYTHETANYVAIDPLSSKPGIYLVDDAENELNRILKIQLTTADLSSDVEFNLELGHDEDIARPHLKLSVTHPEHSNSSSQLSDDESQWEWSYNATRHWTACDEYGKCDKAGEYENLDDDEWDNINVWAHSGVHADANSDGNCDVCGYAIPAPAHDHVAGAWVSMTDGTHHYQRCTVTNCSFNSDALTLEAFASDADAVTQLNYGEHDFSANSGNAAVCAVCGGKNTAHTHVAATDWTITETYHYKQCTVTGCTFNGADVAQSAFTADASAATALSYAEHTSPCTTCGYVHVHTPGTTYVKVGTDYHYTPCTADGCPFHAEDLTAADFTDAAVAAALNFEAHTMTYYNACEKCGYHTVHTPEEYWVTNGGNHYHPCMAVGCPLSSVYLTGEETALDDDAKTALSFGAHVDANQDNKCDVCTKDMSVHEHFFTNEWTQTATTHYHKCITQGCTLVYTTAGLENESQDVKDAVDFGEHSFTGNVCTVCGYEKHVHHFADVTAWTQTATGHYHKCLIQGCNITDYSSTDNLTADEIAAIAYAEHSFGTGTVCSVCGYDKAAAHVHVFGDWSETTDKQYHYKVCSAGGCTITDYTNMSDLQKAETSYGKHQYGTSQEGTAYYTCKICGIENATRKAETHTHSYMWVSIPTGTGATDEDPEHWQQCTSTVGACIADQPEAGDGPRKVPAEKKHQFVTTATDYTYYTCSVCGYIDEEKKAIVPHGHVIDTETWASNDAAHYHECIGQGNCDITNYSSLPASVTAAQTTAIAYAEHTYGTSQQGAKYYTCQVCGYISEARRTEAHEHNYGAWQHDNVQHWKECLEAAGPCDAPKGSLGNHVYGTSGDARWTCSTCSFVNTARQAAILNAETAMNVQSWSWDYEIPFNFEAPVQNDRRFNANQCYTVILPYALELNGMKAYTIEQHNDKIVGFKEQAVTELTQLKPYILKSETTGNPLSMPMTTIYSTLLKSDNASDVAAWMTQAEKDALLDDRATVGNQPSINDGTSPLSMIGTLKYLKAEAVGLYILQGKDADHPNGVFKKVETAGGYEATGDNRASVLPMRAYLKATTSGPARLLSVVFYAADGSVTAVERLALDEDGLAVIYDLQGRRVQNPRKGGLYIINGRKSILK